MKYLSYTFEVCKSIRQKYLKMVAIICGVFGQVVYLN